MHLTWFEIILANLPPIFYLLKMWVSKKLLLGNLGMKVISWMNKPVFTKIILLFEDKTKFHMVKGITNAFDHVEFCLVINLTMGGSRAVTWLPLIATRFVSFATTLNTR